LSGFLFAVRAVSQKSKVEAYPGVGTTAKCRIRGAGIFAETFTLTSLCFPAAGGAYDLLWGVGAQFTSVNLRTTAGADLSPQTVRAFDPIAG